MRDRGQLHARLALVLELCASECSDSRMRTGTAVQLSFNGSCLPGLSASATDAAGSRADGVAVDEMGASREARRTQSLGELAGALATLARLLTE